VRALLQVIADFTNFNVVTSDTVSGSLTLRLKDVPWDQALDIILQAKGLGMRKSGNVIWIAPKDELAAKEQAELEARKRSPSSSRCARSRSS
jgi:type IV pilus assembly protein PilQ